MIYLLVLIFFFLYSISLFIIKNYLLFIITFIFNIIISLILHIPIKKHISTIKKNLLFILFIFICNILFTNLNDTIKIIIRLFLIIDYTYIMNYYFNPTKLKIAFNYLFYPLKIFKIDTNSLTLIVAIALAFIPILIDEATIIKLSLKSKGLEFSFKNVVTRPHIFLITYLNSLFDRLEELEKSLIIKAY